MNLYSPIYPPDVKPARRGLYLTTVWTDWRFVGLNCWDGAAWFDAGGKEKDGNMVGVHVYGQHRYWRGLSFDPVALEAVFLRD